MHGFPVGLVTIKNVKHNEYLYSSDAKLDSQRRHVLSSIGGGAPPCPATAAQWEIFPCGNGYCQIRNAATQEVLYAGGLHCKENRRRVLTWFDDSRNDNTLWEIELCGVNFAIKNVKYQEWMYVSEPKFNEANRLAVAYKAQDYWCIVQVSKSSNQEHNGEFQVSLVQLQDENSRVEALNRYLEAKVAELEERCEQQAALIMKLDQENVSLRADLSDKLRLVIEILATAHICSASQNHTNMPWIDLVFGSNVNTSAMEVGSQDDAHFVKAPPAYLRRTLPCILGTPRANLESYIHSLKRLCNEAELNSNSSVKATSKRWTPAKTLALLSSTYCFLPLMASSRNLDGN